MDSTPSRTDAIDTAHLARDAVRDGVADRVTLTNGRTSVDLGGDTMVITGDLDESLVAIGGHRRVGYTHRDAVLTVHLGGADPVTVFAALRLDGSWESSHPLTACTCAWDDDALASLTAVAAAAPESYAAAWTAFRSNGSLPAAPEDARPLLNGGFLADEPSAGRLVDGERDLLAVRDADGDWTITTTASGREAAKAVEAVEPAETAEPAEAAEDTQPAKKTSRQRRPVVQVGEVDTSDLDPVRELLTGEAPGDPDGQQELIELLKDAHKGLARRRRDLERPPVNPDTVQRLAERVDVDIAAGTGPELRKAEETLKAATYQLVDAHLGSIQTLTRLGKVAANLGDDALAAQVTELTAEHQRLVNEHRDLIPGII